MADRLNNARIFRDIFLKGGLAPHQADALVGGLMQESGKGLNTSAVGDNGTAFGAAQWRGDRLAGLNNFAAKFGLNRTDPSLQAQYILHELNGPEKRAGDMLRNASNVEEAAKAAISFERPKGWSWDNPSAGHGWDNRLSMAQNLPGLLGGGSMAGVAPAASTPALPTAGLLSMQPSNVTPSAPTAETALADNKDVTGGLDMLAKAFKGGSGGQQQQQQEQMTPMSNYSAEQAARASSAQALMAQLLAKQKMPRGILG